MGAYATQKCHLTDSDSQKPCVICFKLLEATLSQGRHDQADHLFSDSMARLFGVPNSSEKYPRLG
jgi:hypothetical protein